MNLRNIFLACAIAVVPTLTFAQSEGEYRKDDKFLFNHLSIGGNLGTTGVGIDVAMPINKHLSLRAGVSGLVLGTFNIKVANSMDEVYSLMRLDAKDLQENERNKKVAIGINSTNVTGHILLDYHPWKWTGFHLTAGAYIGNRNVLHIFNSVEGDLKFLNKTNENVKTYNELFHSNFRDAGIRFGDYIFTADKDGNMDVRMEVWAVRPYVGIGWGRNVNTYRKNKVLVNFDLGAQFWGRPKMKFNNGEKIVKTSDSNEGGIFSILSGFYAWPTLKIRISGDIF